MIGLGDQGALLGDPADESFLDTPNCTTCLTRMDVAESRGGQPYWSCAACGASRLS